MCHRVCYIFSSPDPAYPDSYIEDMALVRCDHEAYETKSTHFGFGCPSPTTSGPVRVNYASCWYQGRRIASVSEDTCKQYMMEAIRRAKRDGVTGLPPKLSSETIAQRSLDYWRMEG